MKHYPFKRQSGLLLHPTCIPGKEGIGTLGSGAKDFLDFACTAGARLWQVCPLGPTGYGDSPYQCFSSMAGNPLLIDMETLTKEGWLKADELVPLQSLPQDYVDFGALIQPKWELLALACRRFKERVNSGSREGVLASARYQAFCAKERSWLGDYALFMALKNHFQGASWIEWPEGVRDRDQGILAKYRRDLAHEIEVQTFAQWQFFAQWNQIRAHAMDRGISILGDMPIFVAYDSVDVWTRRDLFQLDKKGKPLVVAGVPPDYFSSTGQLWGNPLYDWEAMEANGFAWWIQVLKQKFSMYDMVRIDHFRGFAAYWAVPGGDPTAEHGRWIKAPGKKLFAAILDALGQVPIIAEDLGVITPDVEELKELCGFPGMKVLQFAFDSAEENDHLPHNYKNHSLVYTGTHDNDTVRGWFAQAKEADKTYARNYLGITGQDNAVSWEFIRAAMASVPVMAVIPLQDVLGLGPEARMNTPGTLGGNWTWRYRKQELKPNLALKFRELAALYGRC